MGFFQKRWEKNRMLTWEYLMSTCDFFPTLVLSAAFLRGNGVTRRTQKVIQGGDNGHVGRPC